MKKNLNRGISMLLSVAMLISLLTVGAYAEGGEAAPAEAEESVAAETAATQDGLLDAGAETDAALTVGSAAQLINRLMKDTGPTYDSSIIGTEDEAASATAVLIAAGTLEEGTDASASMTGPAFDALLAKTLRTNSLDCVEEYTATPENATVQDAYDTLTEVVLVLRNGANVTCDTDQFLCIDNTSSWTAESTSGSLHLAGIIGSSTISRMHGEGEYGFDLETKTYKGVTVYYNAYAGTDNRMASDPSSFEMGYLEGGARLYPDYPDGLADVIAAGAEYYNTDVINQSNYDITGKTAAVYVNDDATYYIQSNLAAETAFGDAAKAIAPVNLSNLGTGDAVNAAGENTKLVINGSYIESTSGRGVSAVAGAEVDITNSVIDNTNGNGNHGVCVLYGSVLDVKESEITSNTSALSSDFGGGLILADHVIAHAHERGGGCLADGMTFAYITNSTLVTDTDAAASTAGCGQLNIEDSYLQASNDNHGIIYSYVFGMLASDYRSQINVTNSELAGTSDAIIHIQANSIDATFNNDDISGCDVDYLVYAENATVPASFYTRAVINLENMDIEDLNVYFNDDTTQPCVKGYTDCYLTINVGSNVMWTGAVEQGNVQINVINADGEYVPYAYTLGEDFTIDTTDTGTVKVGLIGITGDEGRDYFYQSVIFADNNGIDELHSIGGDQGLKTSYDPASGIREITNVGDSTNITVDADLTNGITILGGKYEIKDVSIVSNGNGGDDFGLWGTAVGAAGDSTVILDNVNIKTTGIINTAISATNDSTLVVKNSHIETYGQNNDNYWVPSNALRGAISMCPWVLGLKGTLRSTNVLGNANVIYYNTYAQSNGWGVLSTDSCTGAYHTLINTTAVLNETSGATSGYGIYANGTLTANYLGIDLDVITDGIVVTDGGVINLESSSQANLNRLPDKVKTVVEDEIGIENIAEKNSTITSDRFGILFHSGANATVEIEKGTIINAGDTAFLMKASQRNATAPTININGATVNAPVIAHLMENDDPGIGMYTHDGTWAINAEILAGATYDTTPDDQKQAPATVNISDTAIAGDIYNTRFTSGQDLDVNVKNAQLTGTVSSGTYTHRNVSWYYAYNDEGKLICVDKDGKAYSTKYEEMNFFGSVTTYTYPEGLDITGLGVAETGYVYADDTNTYDIIGYGISYDDCDYISDVEITAAPGQNNDVVMNLTDGATWTVTGTSYLSSLTIDETSSVVAPEGKTVTLTVDGVMTNLASGTYTGDVVLTVTDTVTITGPNMGQLYSLNVSAAAIYNNGKLVESESVTAALQAGENCTVIKSVGDNQNGIMVFGDEGNTEKVVLKDYTIDFTGYGTNDMGGFGAALYVSSYGNAEFDNFRILTNGATRTAVFVSGHGTAAINNSTIYTFGNTLPSFVTSDLNNMEVPWMLGLTGNCRATNAVGDSNVSYNNDVVIARNWGALSTDTEAVGATPGTVNLDVNKTYAAVLTSGYGAYADGSAEDNFIDSAMDVADIAAIITGSGFVNFEGTTVNAGAYGVMSHSGSQGQIILKNADFHVGETGILVKDSANKVTIDNSTISFDGTATYDKDLAAKFGVDVDEVESLFNANGEVTDFNYIQYLTEGATTLVKMQHNNDAGSGSADGSLPQVTVISNSTLTGDIINSAADVLSVTTVMMGNERTVDRPARSMEVTLDNTTITGAITLAKDTWTSTDLVTMSGTKCDLKYVESMEFGFFTDGEHGLSLTLTNGSVWNVTETSYLTSITVDEGCTVNGTITEVEGGYMVTPAADQPDQPDQPDEKPDGDPIPNTVTFTGDEKTFIISGETETAAGQHEVNFAVTAAEGYKIVSVTTENNVTFTDNGDGTYTIGFTMEGDTDATVAVVTEAVSAPDQPDTPDTFKYLDDNGAGTWSWAAQYIYSVRDKGVMIGEAYKSGYIFNADDNLTRAQAAVIMLAVKGIKVDENAEIPFTDVDAGAWYAPYVATAAANGLTAGNGDGTFAPEANITRAEFVTMLLAACGLDEPLNEGLTFKDVDADAWYAPYINIAADYAIVAGDENGNFNPEAAIIRAEAATMVNNCC